MKYYIIVGEASGDLHGSNLIRELRNLDPEAQFRCWGGDLMAAQGAEIVKHYRDLAFMGFAEVVANLPTILRNLSFCKSDIREFKPDALILIDYPGFNMRIAKFARQQGIRVFYYISPQIWAWKQNRARAIKRDVDRMFVILPFEKEFYARFGMDVSFVGHPLLDAINNHQTQYAELQTENRPIIALLPGSRKQEISKMLPIMLKSVEGLDQFSVIIAGAPSQSPEFYAPYLQDTKARIIYNNTYNLLSRARVAAVTSGTATLETALFGVPEVVCYKGSKISYWLARKLIKVKFISLVNLVLNREAVPELIQDEFNVEKLRKLLLELAADTERRRKMEDDFTMLRGILGGPGASERAAKEMLHLLRS